MLVSSVLLFASFKSFICTCRCNRPLWSRRSNIKRHNAPHLKQAFKFRCELGVKCRIFITADALFYTGSLIFSFHGFRLRSSSIFASGRNWLDLFAQARTLLRGDVRRRCDDLSHVVCVHRRQQFASEDKVCWRIPGSIVSGRVKDKLELRYAFVPILVATFHVLHDHCFDCSIRAFDWIAVRRVCWRIHMSNLV